MISDLELKALYLIVFLRPSLISIQTTHDVGLFFHQVLFPHQVESKRIDFSYLPYLGI